MDNHSHTKWQLKSFIQKTDTELQKINCCPFSNKAKLVLRREISKYIRELVSNSIAIAKRQQEDGVSARHVVEASNYLASSPNNRFFRHLGTIGGILCGVSIPTLLMVVLGEQYPSVTVFLGFIGTFLVALHIAKGP